jgi:hypothetical protein
MLALAAVLGSISTSPAFAVSGREKRDRIWSKGIVPTVYGGKLPRSLGVGTVLARGLRTLAKLRPTFADKGDELPKVRDGFKLFHPFGTVAKVTYRSNNAHHFTGLLAGSDVPGLMRLSLAAPPSARRFIPGVSLKLFVDGEGESANALFLNERGLDGQQPDQNFFAYDFTNRVPKPKAWTLRAGATMLSWLAGRDALHIPVGALTARSADGKAVEAPLTPYELILVPSPIATPSISSADFRSEIAANLSVGPVFEVFARETPGHELIHIGNLDVESPALASAYGDRGLFFRHNESERKKPAMGGD